LSSYHKVGDQVSVGNEKVKRPQRRRPDATGLSQTLNVWSGATLRVMPTHTTETLARGSHR